MARDLNALADMAYQLMQGDEATFKAGYSFANALIAVGDHVAVVEAGPLLSNAERAMVAELLHERLRPAIEAQARKPYADHIMREEAKASDLEKLDVVTVAQHLGMQVLIVDEEGKPCRPTRRRGR
jgi:hypothetical protein